MTSASNGSRSPLPSRRQMLIGGGAALAAPLILRGKAWAKGKDLYISTYTGPQGEYIAKKVIPAFEQEHECKVFQRQSTTLPTISLLRTEKSNPTTSVVMVDDLAIPIAKGEGLIVELSRERVPNLAAVFERFIYADGYGVAFAISKVAPWYNTNAVNPAPTSWHDLWDERFRGRYMMITPKFSNSISLLIMAASHATGKPPAQAQYEIEKAWPRMAELKPNVQTIYDTVGSTILQVSRGQGDIAGPDFSKTTIPYMKRGAPIQMINAKEGVFAGVNAMALVANAPEPELGAAFINRMLSSEVQKGLAEATFAAPSIKGLTFADDVLALLPYTDAQLAALNTIDWAFINPRHGEILDMFNQTFG